MYHPRLKGSHYEMGYHYGEILHKSGQNFREYIQLAAEQEKFGRESLQICEEFAPKLMDEIMGLAEGSRTPYQQMAFWLISMYGFGDIHGCTCFCFHENGKTFLTRNSDMFPELKKTSESALYMPEKGNVFLGNSTAFVLMEDGMNEHGLSAALNFLITKTYRPGLNTGMIIRLILEQCATTEEAITLIKNLPIATTQNIILADKDGNMAVVECSPQKVEVRYGNDYLISANHFVTDSMMNEHCNPELNWYRTHDRYDTVATLFQSGSVHCLEDVKDVLSGKRGFICQYDKALNFDTLWSSIYESSNMKIYRAEGNPSKVKFKEDDRLSWGIMEKTKGKKISEH